MAIRRKAAPRKAVRRVMVTATAQKAIAKSAPFPENKQLTRNQMVEQLTRSPHGKLSDYVPVGVRAVAQDPQFFAHLVAWNEQNGQVRDARVALPILSLSEKDFPGELVENSLAHIALLDPRMLEQAYRFALSVRVPGRSRALDRVVEKYLRIRESEWGWWTRAALQHRSAMRGLYALAHIKPSPMAKRILFEKDYPKGSIFETLKTLKDRSAAEIAATIIKHRIPFLTLSSALGPKLKDPDVVLAMIKQMSPTELVTSMKMLKRLGVKENAILRAALDEALGKLADSKKATLKTTRAAEAQTDERLKTKLVAAQEKQLKALSIDGNWLVLGDSSGSMTATIEAACQVAGLLSKLVKGDVHLVFFSGHPTYYPVTGLDYEQVKRKVGRIGASGGTSIGCGLQSIMDRDIEVDGIAVVSDAQENSLPAFARVYGDYSRKIGKAVPVYLYRFEPSMRSSQDIDLSASMRALGHDLQEFDLRGGVDHYSLPNLAQTMRASRYSLGDEIMSTPLKTLEEAYAWRP